MSYRCAVCGQAVRPGLTRCTHVLYRQVPDPRTIILPDGSRALQSSRTEVAREIPVCGACQIQLEGGTPLAVVARTRRQEVADQAAMGLFKVKAEPPVLLPTSVPVEVAVAGKVAPPAPKRIKFGKGGAG